MPATLSVNLNAVALLRNRRNLPWPSITTMARIALRAGARGLTVHPRPDERHIRFSDLATLRSLIQNEFPTAELNIEGYPSQHFLSRAEQYADQITLVPDSAEQMTSDHGWAFDNDVHFLSLIIERLKKRQIRVALFADPTVAGLKTAQKMGADCVEFYTGPYGGAFDSQKKQHELKKLGQAAIHAHGLGLLVNAGHDLTVDNIPALVKAIPQLHEVSIGHGLIADALEYGIATTIKRFQAALGHT